jgi:hypothetical protein
MNYKKSQSSLVIFFILIIFGIVYFVGLAGSVGQMTAEAAVSGGLTGLDGWFFSNFNFVITIAYIIALMGIGFWGMR